MQLTRFGGREVAGRAARTQGASRGGQEGTRDRRLWLCKEAGEAGMQRLELREKHTKGHSLRSRLALERICFICNVPGKTWGLRHCPVCSRQVRAPWPASREAQAELIITKVTLCPAALCTVPRALLSLKSLPVLQGILAFYTRLHDARPGSWGLVSCSLPSPLAAKPTLPGSELAPSACWPSLWACYRTLTQNPLPSE